MKKFIGYIKKHKVISVIVLLVIIAIIFSLTSGGNNAEKFSLAKVSNQEIYEEVSVTGKVLPLDNANLSFDKNGKVASIRVSVGDQVKKGDILITQNLDEEYANLRLAEADLLSEKSRLADLQNGTRPEQLAVYENKLEGAKSNYNSAKDALNVALKDAYLNSEDSIRNHIDSLFEDAESVNPKIIIPSFDYSEKQAFSNSRLTVTEVLKKWKDNLYITENVNSNVSIAKDSIAKIRNFADMLSLEINQLSPKGGGLSEETISNYRSIVLEASKQLSVLDNSLNTAFNNFKSAESALNVASNEFELGQAGNTVESINSQEAIVNKMQASVDLMKSKINGGTIVAPFDGVVTKIEPKIGEVFNSGVVALGIMSLGGFKVEVKVPEVDIARLAVGNKADIVLNAFGKDSKLAAIVNKINPAEEVFEGVPAYKVTLGFINNNPSIKSGMTADVFIFTDKHEALAVPHKAVLMKDGKKIVKVSKSGGFLEKEVKVGVRSANGYTEIIEGLTDADTVYVPESSITK